MMPVAGFPAAAVDFAAGFPAAVGFAAGFPAAAVGFAAGFPAAAAVGLPDFAVFSAFWTGLAHPALAVDLKVAADLMVVAAG
ncbi:hypothetical protein M8J75_014922 [Diaphorina citri]|nr:hypothetical protein M8J75_014922 [Diaphorina citri]